MITNYLSVQKQYENKIIIERSVFIAYISEAETETDAKNFIGKIKEKHKDATHNCSAYITDGGSTVRFSDDGEPSGTAGMPILDVIKNNGLLNTVIVVTRYFGGIKLGAGGLVRAYSNSASKVLQKSEKVKYELCRELEVMLSYENYNAFENYLNVKKIKITDKIFDAEIKIKIAIKHEEFETIKKQINDFLMGKGNFKEGRSKYIPEYV